MSNYATLFKQSTGKNLPANGDSITLTATELTDYAKCLLDNCISFMSSNLNPANGLAATSNRGRVLRHFGVAPPVEIKQVYHITVGGYSLIGPIDDLTEATQVYQRIKDELCVSEIVISKGFGNMQFEMRPVAASILQAASGVVV